MTTQFKRGTIISHPSCHGEEFTIIEVFTRPELYNLQVTKSNSRLGATYQSVALGHPWYALSPENMYNALMNAMKD